MSRIFMALLGKRLRRRRHRRPRKKNSPMTNDEIRLHGLVLALGVFFLVLLWAR